MRGQGLLGAPGGQGVTNPARTWVLPWEAHVRFLTSKAVREYVCVATKLVVIWDRTTGSASWAQGTHTELGLPEEGFLAVLRWPTRGISADDLPRAL